MANIVDFLSRRLEPNTPEMQTLLATGGGLSDPKKVEKALADSDYVTVLTAVWSERDRPKRLDWLRKQLPRYDAILMHELALAEFKAAPNLEVLQNVVLPLFMAAKLRLEQDSKCIGLLVKEVPDKIGAVYVRAIENLRGALSFPLPEEASPGFFKKTLEHIKNIRAAGLPSPVWIAFGYLGNSEIEAIGKSSAEKWRVVREEECSLYKGGIMLLGIFPLLRLIKGMFG